MFVSRISRTTLGRVGIYARCDTPLGESASYLHVLQKSWLKVPHRARERFVSVSKSFSYRSTYSYTMNQREIYLATLCTPQA